MSDSKIPAIVRDFAAVDHTETELAAMLTTRGDQYKKLATTILKRKVKELNKDTIIGEAERLIVIAKTIVSESGYEIVNDNAMKNCWKAVKDIMIQRMTAKHCPKLTIKVPAGKDDKGNIVIDKVKIGDLPETPRQLADNAAKIKKVLNPDSTDGRSNNGKTRGAQNDVKDKTETGAPQEHSNDVTKKSWSDSFALAFKQVATTKLLMRAIIDSFPKIAKHGEAMGYKLTCEKINTGK